MDFTLLQAAQNTAHCAARVMLLLRKIQSLHKHFVKRSAFLSHSPETLIAGDRSNGLAAISTCDEPRVPRA
jgi:hypothetical protein